MKKKRSQLSTTERAKIFVSLLTHSKLKEAIYFICKREAGGILQPDDAEEKLSNLVKDTLLSKYPEGRDINLKDISRYNECSDQQNIIVNTYTVEIVTKKLSRSHGPTGVDA